MRRRATPVVAALAKRDLRRYFSSAIGYVLVTLFVLVSGAAAFWRPAFFLNSLANLDQLNQDFPWILLLVIPAFCMTLWSDERKQGTDELLLTLPATERDLVAGKYLAAVGIYSLALAASASHVVVLWSLGHPDWGLLAANYLGFWLLGAALIPLALLGSLATANATIAFILGTLFCALPIAVAEGAGSVSAATARRLAALSVTPYFQDFTRGIVSLASVVYFAGLAALALYLGVLVLQHRRRPGGAAFAWHAAARTVALATIVGCGVALSARTGARVDLTLEKLYSLSGPTKSLIGALPADRPVVIQAFISPEMPEPLVQTREDLVGVLHEVEARSGTKVTLAIQEAEPYSPQARLARERYGILPRDVVDPATGETMHDVYLGVAVVSGPDEQVIPFFDRGLSPEYEVARALRVVTGAARKRVGILDSDARILGGTDYRSNRTHPAWAAVQELRKQYDVVEVTPASAPDAKVDALVLVLPSRLTQTDLDLAMQPVARGIPTVLIVDPLPLFDLTLAPAADLASQIDPYRPVPAARTVFGNIRQSLERIGINWVPARIVWDGFNPHPDMADLPQETLFVGPGNGNPRAFNPQDPATARLQEVMFLYPGSLLPASQGGFTFEPLVQTGAVSGSSSFFDLVVPTQNGMAISGDVSREPDHEPHAIAAHVRSTTSPGGAGARPVDVIAIADLDFLSDYFFTLRAAAPPNASFDNISFFLNAIDELAGDTPFIALRGRAGRHRTLERLEAQTRAFVERRAREEHQADEEARVATEGARTRLKQRVDALNAREDLDTQAKRSMVLNLQESEERQLRVFEAGINDAKGAKIRASRETMETEIRSIRRRIRAMAVLLPPAPVLAMGLVVFVRRTRRERQGERTLRRARGGGMTSGTRLTAGLCGGALALLLVTWATAPRVRTPAAFAERGETMFPQFRDPNAAVSLEITAFDSRTASLRTFKVQSRDGRWTIPSQHDYPAEAGDRIAQMAAVLVALKKDDIVSDNAADHTRCDVVDPLDQAVPSLAGRGTRLVVRGAQDAVLADVIVGKTAEGHSGYRYVRQPARARVYASYVGDLKISLDFGDWIERDILKIAPDEIDAVNIRTYSLDRGAGQFRAGDTLLLQKNRADAWGLQGSVATDRPNLAAIDKVLRAVANLRVAGVMPKSPGITGILGQESGRATIDAEDRTDMARKGFYLTPDGQLLSNHGEVVVRTTRGIFYTLRFGDVATGVDAAAGSDETSGARPENRYLFVMVNFDRGSARTSDLAAEGEERARSLRARFAPWYYVIAGQSYADIRATRAELIAPANPPAAR